MLAEFDWVQLWELVKAPDNVPIVMLLVLVPFFVWMAFSQARKNDRLIRSLEEDPDLRKTHHRKRHPYHPDWPKTVHVWPFLLKREFLAAVIVTVILIVWSVCIDAPLEEPANPNLTMNPSKAPWYFLGLQEMLVYFDPWIAGVVLPSVILVGLMAIPYIDVNPLGNGYYTWRQRRFAIAVFCIGFLLMWLTLIFIGTFIRGPGWMWFNPGEFWDHHRLVHEFNRDLHQFFGIQGVWPVFFFGLGVMLLYGGILGGGTHLALTKFAPQLLERLNKLQYIVFMNLWLLMWLLPIKMVLRLVFTVKYIWVTPWFNV